jgi:hypothetical protein
LAKTFIQSLRRIEEMKKLFAVLLVLLFAAPAIAADWNFYGSARVATFYTVRERSSFENEDVDLNHSLQGNSRVGANVKADKISGRFELALRGNDRGDVAGGGPASTAGTGTDDGARTRLIYGDWNFADKSYLRIGKDYSILDFTSVSNQVYGADNDLTGLAPTGYRINQVTLKMGGLEFSLAQPNTSYTYLSNTQEDDAKYPKLEAAYTLALDKVSFKFGGGFNWVESNDITGSREDIYAYQLAAMVKLALGAFYANAAGFYGQNITNGAWSLDGLGQVNAYSTAGNDDGDLEDSISYGGGGEVGLNFSDTLAFGVGGGYRVDNQKAAADETEDWYNVYANLTYKIAPGFKITPEVGYIDRQDNFTTGRSEGYDWYAGLQWRIDF